MTICPMMNRGRGCSPTRHALGALLLEQGRVEEAEAVYRADLGLDGTLRASLSASGERLESAWLSRMPDASGQARRSPDHQAASRNCRRLGGRADQVFLFLPDARRRHNEPVGFDAKRSEKDN